MCECWNQKSEHTLTNFTILALSESSGTDSNFFGVEANRLSAVPIINAVTVLYASPSNLVLAKPSLKTVPAAAAAPPWIVKAGRLNTVGFAVVARETRGLSVCNSMLRR